MDLFYEIKWACVEDGKKYEKMIEKERVFDFLHGLNADLDEVRGRLLGTKPFPSIREVFVEVMREESRKRVMLNPSGMPNSDASSQTSALVSSRIKPPSSFKGEPQKDKPWCEHCNKPYHTKET